MPSPVPRFEDPFPDRGDRNAPRAKVAIGFAISPYQPYEYVGDAPYSVGLTSNGEVRVNRSGTIEKYQLCAVRVGARRGCTMLCVTTRHTCEARLSHA